MGEADEMYEMVIDVVKDQNETRRRRSKSQGSLFAGSRVIKAVTKFSKGQWQCRVENCNLSWKDEVFSILQSFTERTPGSCLELKDSSFTWHFGEADPDFGFAQAKNLQMHFDQMFKSQHVRVMMAPIKKYIVIHPANINKGKAISSILHKDPRGFDLILGIGDERTDEDMFDVLQGSSQCFTCTVGKKITKAQYYIDSTESVILTLQALPAAALHYSTGTGAGSSSMSVTMQNSISRSRLPATPNSKVSSPRPKTVSPFNASLRLPGAFMDKRVPDTSEYFTRTDSFYEEMD